MLRSMTGYGAARVEAPFAEISVEIKSVNNRYLDCNIKLPRAYGAAEDTLKAMVSRAVGRGKVDVYVTADVSRTNTVTLCMNELLADAYMELLGETASRYDLKRGLTAAELLRFPDVLTVERGETDDAAVLQALADAVGQALAAFNAQRAREGARLGEDIETRLLELERLIGLVEERSPQTVAEYRQKLETRMKEILRDRQLDETRLLTEAALFADRVAVAEETVRLRSHLAELRGLLRQDEPAGRKLDFLVQECNREANTIGSKCSDASLARVVVDLKVEIEKIREQAQNLE